MYVYWTQIKKKETDTVILGGFYSRHPPRRKKFGAREIVRVVFGRSSVGGGNNA